MDSVTWQRAGDSGKGMETGKPARNDGATGEMVAFKNRIVDTASVEMLHRYDGNHKTILADIMRLIIVLTDLHCRSCTMMDRTFIYRITDNRFSSQQQHIGTNDQ